MIAGAIACCSWIATRPCPPSRDTSTTRHHAVTYTYPAATASTHVTSPAWNYRFSPKIYPQSNSHLRPPDPAP